MAIAGVGCALIVGGGIGGMAAALQLRAAGVRVDLVEADPDWRVYGAGITITGPTLRAYDSLGLLEEIRHKGAITHLTRLRLFNGTVLRDLEEPAMSDGKPSTGGILRPVLHALMSDRVRAAGVCIKLGTTVQAIEQHGETVDARLSDGERGSYDLVIGADGIYSHVRQMIFPDAVQPTYTGQGSWRILADRPPGLDANEFYLGHANMVGLIACSPTQMYVFMLNTDPGRTRIAPEDQPERVRELLAEFGGNIGPIRDKVGIDSSIVYRPLESAFQPAPWHKGRVVIIGDAAHATTPHLASGAGMAVEDAVVLVQELGDAARSVPDRLASFTSRRYERCRMVVENSLEIGRLQMANAPFAQVGELTGQSLHALSQII